jgi:hypothetical protein
MLNIYRRHLKSCPQKPMRYKRCKCPICVVGRGKGEFVRESLGLVNWERAQAVVRAWEVEDLPPQETVTIERAADSFLQDAESRHLKESSLAKYKLLFRELKVHNPLRDSHA